MKDDKLQNSPLIQAFRGKRISRTPVWFMRQAGRYLPEYREIRKQHSMLEAIRTPKLAAQITLQPLERFDLDAAIIFADILNPLIGMGIELDFIAGEGPKIFNPIESIDHVRALKNPLAADNVGYTLEAIELVSSKLEPRGVPLIGFSGSPFTLACYMIKGEGSAGHFVEARRFMLEQSDAWTMLQDKLALLVADYLIAQVKHGASAVQLFDSWVGLLSPSQFGEYVLPTIQKIVTTYKASCSAPICYFGTGAAGLYPQYSKIGADIYGVDWRSSLKDAARLIGPNAPLQGNLDPLTLFGTEQLLAQEVQRIIDEGRTLPAHVFNLGHGLLPGTPIERVEYAINLIHSR